MSGKSKTAEIRARLKHPVIDSDGHSSEYLPVVDRIHHRGRGEERCG